MSKHFRYSSRAAIALLATVFVFDGCSEHDEHGEEGEESGTRYAPDEAHDEVRGGARLILEYDSESNSFVGTVENVSEEVLDQVRVEVHLSNGTELGPTSPRDLEPGEFSDVELAATDKSFEWWSTHSEVGSDEHGGGCEAEHS